ncbi:hypothetical protein [Paenibacillus wenxiniae]|uniref:YtkA-like domain-containing protein n=1 Tax=Paenibacillus wenxiniae TaxID=1636843 RepID=A0ABW4RFT8_9BACL
MKTKKRFYSMVLLIVVGVAALLLNGVDNDHSNVKQAHTDVLTTIDNKPGFSSDPLIDNTIMVKDVLNNDTYQKSITISGGYLKISINNRSTASMTFTLNKNGSNGPLILLGVVDAKHNEFYTDATLEKGDYMITISSGSGKMSGDLSMIAGSNLEALKNN